MSWSIYTVAKPADIENRVNALTPPGDTFAERDDQLVAAKAAAIALIASKCVGDGEAFQVTLAGHANTGHAPTPNWANDTVGVTVTQVSASAVEQFDVQQAQAQRNLE